MSGIIFILFIILSITLLIAWFFLVKRIRSKTQLASEQLFLLAMTLLIVVGMSIWKLGSYLGNGKSSSGPVISEELQQFTARAYQPLVFTRQTLASEIKDMNTLLYDIDDLVDDHPHHANLLLEIKRIWSRGVYQLKILDKEVDQEIRRAWIAHDTKNTGLIDSQFAREAVKIDKHIKQELKTFRNLILKVHDLLHKDIGAIQKTIGKQENKKQEPFRNTRAFSNKTTKKLLIFLKQQDEDLHAEFIRLIDEINISEQRQEQVTHHLENNDDLAEPLIKVIHSWRAIEKENRYYYEQLLYALEATLLGRNLGLNKNDYAIVSMRKTLNKQIPAIVKKRNEKRNTLENSY